MFCLYLTTTVLVAVRPSRSVTLNVCRPGASGVQAIDRLLPCRAGSEPVAERLRGRRGPQES